jgi:hypothetical protein
MPIALFLLLLSGPLLVAALVAGAWKYALAWVAITVGLRVAGEVQARLEKRRINAAAMRP